MHRIGWLRAAVLGANDGIVSTASLIVGVAAAAESREAILLAGTAGLVAGAMSMAAGEYISVSSQADTEAADLAREGTELAAQPEFELRELAGIYEARGLSKQLAAEVARELSERDALASHARDELGITEVATARPVQAALTSAATFAVGAALPLLSILIAPGGVVISDGRGHRTSCPSGARHSWGARRRGQPVARYASSNFLGRARHGGDRCNRDAFWRGCVASDKAISRTSVQMEGAAAPLLPSPPPLSIRLATQSYSGRRQAAPDSPEDLHQFAYPQHRARHGGAEQPVASAQRDGAETRC